MAVRENTHRATRGEEDRDPYNQKDYHVVNHKQRRIGRKQESLKRLKNPQKVMLDPFNETLED